VKDGVIQMKRFRVSIVGHVLEFYRKGHLQ